MKLLIDIPEDKYEWINKNNPNADTNSIVGAIANGISVSTEGDLISREDLIREACVKFYTTPYYKHILDLINNAPTVEPKLSNEQIEKITRLLENEWGYEGMREDVARILREADNAD